MSSGSGFWSGGGGGIEGVTDAWANEVVGEGRGGRRMFSHNRSRSQDSRAENWEGERRGRGRARVEILCWWISRYYILLYFEEYLKRGDRFRVGGGERRAYRINVTMRPFPLLLQFFKRLDAIIGV